MRVIFKVLVFAVLHDEADKQSVSTLLYMLQKSDKSYELGGVLEKSYRLSGVLSRKEIEKISIDEESLCFIHDTSKENKNCCCCCCYCKTNCKC